MPRVSVRRLFVYAIYTVVVTSLVMLALHVQQQNPLWLRVLEQAPVQGGYYQQNSKEIEDEPSTNFVLLSDEESGLENATSNALRRRGMPWYIRNDGYKPKPGDPLLNVWPTRLNGDRIEEQLMIPPRTVEQRPVDGSSHKSKPAPLKKIFLPNGLGSWQVKGGQKVFADQKCPIDRCTLTSKRSEAATADAIMFKGN